LALHQLTDVESNYQPLFLLQELKREFHKPNPQPQPHSFFYRITRSLNHFAYIFFQELRKEFDKSNLLLTAAFGVAPATAEKAYDVAALSQYLDFLHLMCYDLHGTWDGITGHNAPLKRTRPEDEGLSVVSLFSSCLKY